MGRATLITCRVLDAEDRPVEFARAYFTRAPVPMPDIAALSDADGRVTLSAPSPGSYRLQVTAEGLGRSELEFEVTGEGDVEKVLRLERE